MLVSYLFSCEILPCLMGATTITMWEVVRNAESKAPTESEAAY